MKAVYSPLHLKHHPKTYYRGGAFHEPPEVPARAEAIHDAMLAAGHTFVEADDHGPGPRAGVHTPGYLGFLSDAHQRWQALGSESDEVLPNIHLEDGSTDGALATSGEMSSQWFQVVRVWYRRDTPAPPPLP